MIAVARIVTGQRPSAQLERRPVVRWHRSRHAAVSVHNAVPRHRPYQFEFSRTSQSPLRLTVSARFRKINVWKTGIDARSAGALSESPPNGTDSSFTPARAAESTARIQCRRSTNAREKGTGVGAYGAVLTAKKSDVSGQEATRSRGSEKQYAQLSVQAMAFLTRGVAHAADRSA